MVPATRCVSSFGSYTILFISKYINHSKKKVETIASKLEYKANCKDALAGRVRVSADSVQHVVCLSHDVVLCVSVLFPTDPRFPKATSRSKYSIRKAKKAPLNMSLTNNDNSPVR
jgi:hypothetical protein